MQRTGGTVRIDELATRIGWGRRRLTREFRAEYGVSPKQAARVTRFDRSRRLLAAGRPLAELAASAGFFDQAHLSREYAALAERSPGQLRASAYHLA
nr:helix-turn-helix domain-containing protein [Naumannella cuiyingiana]